MKSGRGKIKDWWDGLDPEAKAAHIEKLKAARRTKMEARRRSSVDPFYRDPERDCRFKALLGEFITATAGRTGTGEFTPLWCTLCLHIGTTIHLGNGPVACNCVCHRARKALSEYDDHRT